MGSEKRRKGVEEEMMMDDVGAWTVWFGQPSINGDDPSDNLERPHKDIGQQPVPVSIFAPLHLSHAIPVVVPVVNIDADNSSPPPARQPPLA